MTDEQASDWEYKIICCLGISTSNSDINVVGLHKTVTELYEQGRADEREAQVCCGDYEKCMKACTPRGRWLANKQITRFEQEKKQFVGGIPEVSQQREWVGLTLNDITGHMCDCADDDGTYKTSCFIDYAKAIEQKLKDLNT